MVNLTPYLVLGLALGGVFALSSVGIVVLFRATGVLNFAGGAIGALSAFVAWTLTQQWHWNQWVSYLIGILVATAVSVAYGITAGRALAQRPPIVKAVGTLAVLLLLVGFMTVVWPENVTRSMPLPTSAFSVSIGQAVINGTQMLSMAIPIVVTVGTAIFLKKTKLGMAMRALADDREISAMLGVPVRKVEAIAWIGAGVLAGVSGILLSNLVNLAASDLTFLVIPALAVALAARLESLWISLGVGFAIGVLQAALTPFSGISEFRSATPFVVATIAVLWLAWRRPTLGRV